MQTRIVRLILSCIALCASACILDLNAVEIRFLGVETSREDLYLKVDSEYKQMSVPLYNSSAYYHVEAVDGSLQLYTEVDTSEGPVFELAVESKIPNGIQSALAIYRLAPDGQAQLYFYDDAWSTFPAQSYRLINISPVEISSKIEDSLTQVKPFLSDIVQVKTKSNLPLIRVMTVYKGDDNEWKPIYNQRTPLLPDWRITGIAVVTTGKLDEARGIPLSESGSTIAKAKLSYLSFKDSGSTSSQKVAERQKSAQ